MTPPGGPVGGTGTTSTGPTIASPEDAGDDPSPSTTTGAAAVAGTRRRGWRRRSGSSDAAEPGPPPREAWTLPGAVPPAEGRRSTPLVAALVGLLTIPLLVAVAVLHSPRWFPLLDLAQTELRVRDVGGADTPLVGLAGRIQAFGRQGSHPGPISFLALWPVYKLFGTSAWALQVASIVLHVLAMAGILAVAHRRGGTKLALGFAAVLAVLLYGYGTGTFVEPWNPYLPVLWWLLFLVAVWSVVCGDVALLPLAVFAGSFCMQTHVSYLGLVGGMAGLVVLAGVAWAVRRRRDPAALRPLVRWTLLAAALGFVLWLPPLIDQATNDPGNASMIVENFRHPSDDPVGLSAGAELVGVNLNVANLLTGRDATTGSLVPAVALTAVWAVAAVVAVRLRHAALVRLHAVAGAALLLGVVSASRIWGELWYYLALWARGIAAFMVVATVWTFAAALAARPPSRGPAARFGADAGRLARLGTGALVAVAVVWTALFTADATGAEPPAANQSRMLAGLVPDVVGALAADTAGTDGRAGRYLVTWTDPVAIGASGFGLLLELERQGFDVGVTENHARGAVEHRVLDPADATAEVHLSVGADVARWEDRPGAVRVAEVDIRTAEDRARYADLRAGVIADLEAMGRDDLVPVVDGAMMAIAIQPDVGADIRDRGGRDGGHRATGRRVRAPLLTSSASL